VTAVGRIRTPDTNHERIISARTFYVSSLSHKGGEYTVKRFKQAKGPSAAPTLITCNCPDYTHRGQALGLPCKHIHLVNILATALGGWTKVPRTFDVQFGFQST
jgi:hypothetical protein